MEKTGMLTNQEREKYIIIKIYIYIYIKINGKGERTWVCLSGVWS